MSHQELIQQAQEEYRKARAATPADAAALNIGEPVYTPRLRGTETRLLFRQSEIARDGHRVTIRGLSFETRPADCGLPNCFCDEEIWPAGGFIQ